MSLRNPERGLLTVKGLIFSLGLVASFIFVASIYGFLIRPAAEEAALAAQIGIQSGSGANLFILLKDYEQQICFSLLFWGLMIIAYKYFELQSELRIMERYAPGTDHPEAEPEIDLLAGGSSIDRQRAGDLYTSADAKSRQDDQKNSILPYVLARGLERYHMTGSVPEATDTMMGRLEVAAEQQESELSMLRYLVWAIPSIGFIGTVRGIGDALGQAYKAVEGDIAGVTASLGVAFNSTFIALVISILLMFLLHQLQLMQERLVLDTQHYCDQQLLRHLRTRTAS